MSPAKHSAICAEIQQLHQAKERKLLARIAELEARRKQLSDADLGVYVSKEMDEYLDGAYADHGSAKDQLIRFARTIEAAHGIKD